MSNRFKPTRGALQCVILLTFAGQGFCQYPTCFSPDQYPGVCVDLQECQLLSKLRFLQPHEHLDRLYLSLSHAECANKEQSLVCCTESPYPGRRLQTQETLEAPPYSFDRQVPIVPIAFKTPSLQKPESEVPAPEPKIELPLRPQPQPKLPLAPQPQPQLPLAPQPQPNKPSAPVTHLESPVVREQPISSTPTILVGGFPTLPTISPLKAKKQETSVSWGKEDERRNRPTTSRTWTNTRAPLILYEIPPAVQPNHMQNAPATTTKFPHWKTRDQSQRDASTTKRNWENRPGNELGDISSVKPQWQRPATRVPILQVQSQNAVAVTKRNWNAQPILTTKRNWNSQVTVKSVWSPTSAPNRWQTTFSTIKNPQWRNKETSKKYSGVAITPPTENKWSSKKQDSEWRTSSTSTESSKWYWQKRST